MTPWRKSQAKRERANGTACERKCEKRGTKSSCSFVSPTKKSLGAHVAMSRCSPSSFGVCTTLAMFSLSREVLATASAAGYIHLSSNSIYCCSALGCQSMVDAASGFHSACLLQTRESSYVASKFIRHWIGMYGALDVLHLDQGGEFMGAFMGLRVQQRLGNMALLNIMELRLRYLRLVQQRTPRYEEVGRAGYSPEQMVFGHSVSWLSDLAMCQLTTQLEYWPGQTVYFYTETRRRSRHVPCLTGKDGVVQRQFWQERGNEGLHGLHQILTDTWRHRNRHLRLLMSDQCQWKRERMCQSHQR
eukprot:1760540-Amphidinium_carterae.2